MPTHSTKHRSERTFFQPATSGHPGDALKGVFEVDTLPLPPRPDLSQYKKRAKDLVKAATSTEPDAVHAWATVAPDPDPVVGRDRLAVCPGQLRPGRCRAREGRTGKAGEPPAGWPVHPGRRAVHHRAGPRLRELAHLCRPRHRLSRTDKDPDAFEAGADAVVTGDLSTLTRSFARIPAWFAPDRPASTTRRCCTTSPRTELKTSGSRPRPTRWRSRRLCSRRVPRWMPSPTPTAAARRRPR